MGKNIIGVLLILSLAGYVVLLATLPRTGVFHLGKIESPNFNTNVSKIQYGDKSCVFLEFSRKVGNTEPQFMLQCEN